MYDQSISSVASIDSPTTLEKYCLDFICDHLTEMCVRTSNVDDSMVDGNGPGDSTSLAVAEDSFRNFDKMSAPTHSDAAKAGTQEEPMDEDRLDDDHMETEFFPALRSRLRKGDRDKQKRDEILKFAFDDFRCPGDLSEQLLEKLCERRKLDDLTLSLFDASTTRMKKVRIKDASKLTALGLQTLSKHNIQELECIGLTRATVGQLVDNLNEWSLANCRLLNVSRCTFVDHRKAAVLTSLCRFQRLTALNVSGTEFNKSSLEMVVQDLQDLQHIDISSTKVTDITSLLLCRDRLRSLSMYNLKLPSSDAVIEVLVQLKELRHLDISDDTEEDPPFETGKLKVSEILRRTKDWPHLKSLDLSGKDNINICELQEFLQEHSFLTFLGLFLTEACKDDMFAKSELVTKKTEPYDNIRVTGSANETQVLESLSRYMNRQHYIKKSLSILFGLSHSYCVPRVDIIKLVLAAASKYHTVFSIQMAATACLFNLSKNEIGQKLHPRILGQIVNIDLNAMETFPQYHQLQKNVLLTICNDRILQEVNFDRYRCAELVMECLCAWQDNSMNRMSVAICSILAAKISTQETSQLGSHSKYMNKLLSIVRKKVTEKAMDVTLKFTLSALWNLTDESPQTCNVFLQEGGMQLFLEVLQTFSDELPVKTKVLGLLNNIAEVEGLRKHLMIDDFMMHLRCLLYSEDIEVSYFAAGIAAHLSSYSKEDYWTVEKVSKDMIIEDLAKIVEGWKNPDSEVVAYRSFRPFFPLMDVGQVHAVQLWAVWAIHHVCSKNPKRYCPMLIEQGGDVVIVKLIQDGRTHDSVLQLCRLVIETLSQKKCMSLDTTESNK